MRMNAEASAAVLNAFFSLLIFIKLSCFRKLLIQLGSIMMLNRIHSIPRPMIPCIDGHFEEVEFC